MIDMKAVVLLVCLFGAIVSPMKSFRLLQGTTARLHIKQIRRIFAHIRSEVSKREQQQHEKLGGIYLPPPWGVPLDPRLQQTVVMVCGHLTHSVLPPLTPIYTAPVEIDECEFLYS